MSRLVIAVLAVVLALAVAGWDHAPRADAGGPPDLIFPFPDGQTWTLNEAYEDCGSTALCYDIQFTKPDALGEPVRAAAAGTVVADTHFVPYYGWYVIVQHAGGYVTNYFNLSGSGSPPQGTVVTRGQAIGYVGCSADSCVEPYLGFSLGPFSGAVAILPEPICGHTGFEVGQEFINCVPDQDSDGVRDEVENCVGTPEDPDLYDDQDGCPEPEPDEGLRGDFNGDGRSDIAHVCCGDSIYTWLSNGDGTYNTIQFFPGGTYDVQLGSWRVADANGDGKSDLIHLCCANYMHTWFSNGDGTYSIAYFSPGDLYNMQSGSWRVVDANGDGKSDLVHLCCANYMHTWFSNGDGTYSIAYFSAGDLYDMQLGSWRTGDVNGDGKSDLIHLCCSTYIHTWISNGDGSYNVTLFDPPGDYPVQTGSIYVADANGDGKSDVFHICCYDYFHTWLSNGDGTFNVKLYAPPGHVVASGTWKTADVNGDNKSDLVHICCPSSIRTLISNGDGSFNLSAATSGVPGYPAQQESWRVGDVNADGRSDLLHRCCDNHMYTWLANGDGTYNATYFSPSDLYDLPSGSWLAGDFAGDRDGDSFLDGGDNCPAIRNTLQEDADGDEKGDACDVVGTGDVDCDGLINSVDALKLLRNSAGLPVTQSEPCLDMGLPRLVAPPDNWLMGDVNCSSGLNSVDALLVLRASAGLSVNIPIGCPAIKPT